MAFRKAEEEIAIDQEEEIRQGSFLKDLYLYMKQRGTPIERIPHLGFKQIDLFLLYKNVTSLGGYHKVTAQQLWKQVYNALGGNPRSTSAATCTRRHYEKLLLPYECHVKGRDYIEVVPPRQNKRYHSNSMSEDEECPRVPKRKMTYNPLLHQTYPTDTHVRIIPMPLNYPQYNTRSGHPALQSYVPLLPPNGHPVPHSAPQGPSHLPVPSPPPPDTLDPTERAKQPLEYLRYLADEYKFFSGLAPEPLNLSCKDSRQEISNNPASSFTPTSCNKAPKFLNEVSPLYPKGLAKEEGCDVPERDAAKCSPAQLLTYPPNSREGYIIDLTSTRSSHSPLQAPTPGQPASPTPVINGRPSSVALNLSQAPRESGGRMEIQIPLALLHNWIKDGLLGGCSASRPNLLTSTGQTSPPSKVPEPREWEQASSDIPSFRSDPPKLPYHHPYIIQRGSAMPNVRQKSLYGDSSMQSPSITRDLSLTACFGLSTYMQSSCGGNLQNVASRDVYPWEEQEARRPYHSNTIQDQGLQDRSTGEAQSIPLKIQSNSQLLDQDSLGPRSPAYSPNSSQGKVDMSGMGSSAVVRVGPPSPPLGTLTPEEFLKLKRLISRS